jgi:lipopolysaccharide export system permease protein
MKGQIKIIDRYLGSSTIQGFFLVLSVLVVLFSFLDLLAQLNDVGKGSYRLADAFLYAALTIPKRMVDLMPMAALLGSILALGLLADNQELTAMQAAGISVRRMALSVLGTSVLLMVAAVFIAEFIAPPLDQFARIRRSNAVYGKGVMQSKSGFWVRHGQAFVHVGRTFTGGRATDLEVYELDGQGKLRRFIHAGQAVIEADQDWVLTELEAKSFGEDGVSSTALPEYRLEKFLTPSQVGVLELPPDSLSLTDLSSYIHSLRDRAQNAEAYALAFWQKVCLPLTTGSMVLLSLTFIFGSTRMRNAGQRILAGVLVGVLFTLANQIAGHLGLIFGLPPLVMTLLPVAVILLIAFRLLKRVF